MECTTPRFTLRLAMQFKDSCACHNSTNNCQRGITYGQFSKISHGKWQLHKTWFIYYLLGSAVGLNTIHIRKIRTTRTFPPIKFEAATALDRIDVGLGWSRNREYLWNFWLAGPATTKKWKIWPNCKGHYSLLKIFVRLAMTLLRVEIAFHMTFLVLPHLRQQRAWHYDVVPWLRGTREEFLLFLFFWKRQSQLISYHVYIHKYAAIYVK